MGTSRSISFLRQSNRKEKLLIVFNRFLIAASGYSRGDFDTQVSYLQEQINALAASNEALTSQVYLTGDADSFSYANNLISAT